MSVKNCEEKVIRKMSLEEVCEAIYDEVINYIDNVEIDNEYDTWDEGLKVLTVCRQVAAETQEPIVVNALTGPKGFGAAMRIVRLLDLYSDLFYRRADGLLYFEPIGLCVDDSELGLLCFTVN